MQLTLRSGPHTIFIGTNQEAANDDGFLVYKYKLNIKKKQTVGVRPVSNSIL